MTDQQKRKCADIANHYGKDSQVLVAIEEMSELIKELCKYFRRFDRTKEITEEIADVEIMIEQLKTLFENYDEVGNVIDYKLERQMQRMEIEKGSE